MKCYDTTLCNLYNNKRNINNAFNKLIVSAKYADSIGLDVHAGHGLTYESAKKISKIKCVTELNIGHFLISESLFIGLKNSIKKFKKIINSK